MTTQTSSTRSDHVATTARSYLRNISSCLSLIVCLTSVTQAQAPRSLTVERALDASKVAKPAALTITAGLAKEHLRVLPLFDRLSSGARGQVSASRTYPDGAHYVLTGEQLSDQPLRWKRLLTIKPEGVVRAQKIILRDLITYTPVALPQDRPQVGQGYILWVAYRGDHEYIIQTRSGGYDALPSFVRHLDEAISQNVQPMTQKRSSK